MFSYIARQPIFNINKKIRGYELLYRDESGRNSADFTDGDAATCRLLSDAITLFGLRSLTNKHRAYVNFTHNLILNDFVRLTNPKDIVVELLEDIIIDDALVEKLKELKQLGYTLALDDYVGQGQFDVLLPLIDIIKVDFRLASLVTCAQIAKKYKKTKVTLLAEKVETVQEFNAAADMGYTLFQGYFFEKPRIFKKQIPSISASSYGQILGELSKPDVNFDTCARIIHTDPVMTYMLMQRIHSLSYYRGNLVSGIKHALVLMGTSDLRKWLMLLLARENNITQSDEMARGAYLRGMFMERLMTNSRYARESDKGFILGMFSMMDKILGMQMDELLRDVALDKRLETALLGAEENYFFYVLQFVIIYEMANPSLQLPDIGLTISQEKVTELYMQSIVDTDNTFSNFGGSYV